MIRRGVYSVVQHLNISHSLLSQTETEPSDSKNSVYKALLEQNSSHTIAYFADQINFGPNTEIDILHDVNPPILFQNDYHIIKRATGSHNTKLIQKLLHK